ncbi:MAG: hypothetical protein NTX79_07520 [Candidatus Micrarchaeota archaeon]|nr:hypothetical protein [Candidatus Micrarchaeota archaeon]
MGYFYSEHTGLQLAGLNKGRNSDDTHFAMPFRKIFGKNKEKRKKLSSGQ